MEFLEIFNKFWRKLEKIERGNFRNFWEKLGKFWENYEVTPLMF